MILSENVKIKINNKNRKYFTDKGYQCKSFDEIIVKVSDLHIGSIVKIYVKCDICGCEKETPYSYYIKNYSNQHIYVCCEKCAKIKFKKTCIEKYGVDSPFKSDIVKNKIKQSNIEKYGVENVFKSEKIKKKIKQTNLEKYGYEYATQSNKIKDKTKQTNLEKYGCEFVFQNDDVKVKIKQSNLEKYGVEHPFQSTTIYKKYLNSILEKYGFENVAQSSIVKDKIKCTVLKKYGVESIFQFQPYRKKMISTLNENFLNKNILYNIIEKSGNTLKILCPDCNNEYIIDRYQFKGRKRLKTIMCTICNPINSYASSGYELEMYNFIKEKYNGTIITNTKQIISPFELDVYLPDLNLAFEFDGIWWHNNINKPENYHKEKTDLCFNKGIKLIHIVEDDWLNKNDIVKSIILNNLKLYDKTINVNVCEIKEVENTDIIEKFINENYLNKYEQYNINIGLFYNNELISVMLFDLINDECFLSCFCNKINYEIFGADSKMFNFFINKYKFNNIKLIENRFYFYDISYENLGFKKIDNLKPAFEYIINNKRMKYIKEEEKILFENNDKTIYKIYNAGYIKYKYN